MEKLKELRKEYNKLRNKYFSKKYHCLDFGDDEEADKRARQFWYLEGKMFGLSDRLKEEIEFLENFLLLIRANYGFNVIAIEKAVINRLTDLRSLI